MPATPLTFDCEGAALQGMLHAPAVPATIGVVIIVGGPQYRVGSHRQFVHLARALEAAGMAALRFDVRGMGDSAGESRTFEDISADIRAAVDTLQREVPSVRKLILWGLCDAATAASFYVRHDKRIAGIVLLNPWVRDLQLQANTILHNYYGQRVLEPAAWLEILREPRRIAGACKSVLSLARKAVQRRAPTGGADDRSVPLGERMSRALTSVVDVPLLFVLSGDDLTAAEFRKATDAQPWKQILAQPRVSQVEMPEADHTFSRQSWRDSVAASTRQWIESLPAGSTR
jgi:exosortase A-associated hydrolase 1